MQKWYTYIFSVGAHINGVQFDEKIIQSNLRIAITINDEVIEFLVNEKDDDIFCAKFEILVKEIHVAVDEEYKFSVDSCKKLNTIFESLVILIYSAAFAVEHKEFQKKVKILINNAVVCYGIGISITKVVKKACFDVLRGFKGHPPKEIAKKWSSLVSKVHDMHIHVLNTHEQLTDLNVAVTWI